MTRLVATRTPSIDVDPFVEAIHDQRLASYAGEVLADAGAAPAQRSAAQRAETACADIGDHVRREQQLLAVALRDQRIEVETSPIDGGQQNATIALRIADPVAAERAATVLEGLGFEPWERWQGAARRSWHRYGDKMTVARTDDATTVVRLVWRDVPRRRAIARSLAPTAADWSLMSLPEPAWPLYSIVRPARLTAERLGLRRRHEVGIGPFLATPTGLIDPLLDAADVGADDVVVDLGCGDGRLVVDAVQRRGCRGIGVELDPALVARARARATGLPGVRIEHADAWSADVRSATVVLLFLPVGVLGDIVRSLRRRCAPGTRLVAHEQLPLPRSTPRPDATTALFGDAAITVCHRWIV